MYLCVSRISQHTQNISLNIVSPLLSFCVLCGAGIFLSFVFSLNVVSLKGLLTNLPKKFVDLLIILSAIDVFLIWNYKILDNKSFTAKIVLNNETTSHLSVIMTDATLHFGEQQSTFMLLKLRGSLPSMTFVSYPFKTYSGLSLSLAYRDWLSAPARRYFGEILYAVSIVEEAGPTETLCQQAGTTPYFYVAGRASFIVSFYWNGLADAALLLCLLFLLTSQRFIYPSEVIRV